MQGSQLIIKDSSITGFKVTAPSANIVGGAVGIVKSKCDMENDVQIVDGYDRLRDVTRLLHEHIDSLLWDSRETRESMDIEQTEAELADPGALYAPPGGRLLLTLLDDAPVALLALKPHSPDTAEITRLYVRPDARGYGLASQLLDKAVDTARAAGYRQVVLSLMPEMEMVRDMCYRHDFTSIEPYNNDAPDGLIPMGMSLT